MASIAKRDDGSFQLLWREPCASGQMTGTGKPVMVRRTKIVTGLTAKEAARMAASIEERARKEGPAPVVTKATLYGYAWGTFMVEEQPRLALKTLHRTAQLIHGITRLLGVDLMLADVRKTHFKQLVERARAELWPPDHPTKAGKPRNGARQVHHLHSTLKGVVAHAYDAGAIQFNPRVEGIRPPAVPTRGPTVKCASEADTMTLVEALRSDEHPLLRRSALHRDIADIVEFCHLTACRKQEALGLGWHNVMLDPTDGMPPFVRIADVVEEAGSVFRLRSSTKTDRHGGTGRIVVLVRDAVALLRGRRDAWELSGIAETAVPAAGGVFAHPLDGDWWRPSQVSAVVKKAADALGVTSGLHSRRHGAITALRRKGVPIQAISAFAGHTSTAMTEVQYGWIDAEMHQHQVLAIEAGMAAGFGPKALPAPAGLPAEVMLAALDYAKSSGLPLGEVIAMLTGRAVA